MNPIGSHSESTELARQELYDPEAELRVDVLSVAFDDRGAQMRMKVWADGFFSCPRKLLVLRSAEGSVLAHKYVQTKGYKVLGLKSGWVPCTATVSTRLPNVDPQSAIRLELHDGGLTEEEMRNGEGEGPISQTYFLDDLADIASRTSESSSSNPVQSAVESAVSPLVTGGLSLVGVYLLVDNLPLVSDLTRDLFTFDN